MITQENLQNFKDFVNKYQSFVIAGHKEPDGDCISSCLGLAALLQKLGKQTEVLSAGPFKRTETKKYEPLFKSAFGEGRNSKDFGLFVVDCSGMERLGEIDIAGMEFDTFVIDHHKTAKGTGGNCIIDADAPAAVYLVQQLFEAVHGEVTAEVAPLLFFGLCTDTGFFRFLTSADAEVFAAASRLIAKGASPKQTYNEMTGGKAFSTRKLLGVQLDRAERHYGGKLVVTYETLEDAQKYGENGRDSDALYQMLMSIEGVEAVANIKQETEAKCTAGLRSRDEVDVSVIAARFGGGGHKNAAGLSLEIQINDFIPQLVEEFGKIL